MTQATGAPTFEGNEWDAFCGQALARRYGSDWQPIPAKNQGDWGLEGFVRGAGIVVQCYADDSVSNSDRLAKQKGKLTSDVPKLQKYSAVLGPLLEMEVHTYLFLVPSFNDKELLPHARLKAELARSWGLPWITSSFAITVNDFDFFSEEWNALRGGLRSVIDLSGEPAVSPSDDLTRTLEQKLSAMPRLAQDADQTRQWRDTLLRDYIDANGMMLRLNEISPAYADRIVKLVAAREKRLALRTEATEPIDDLLGLTSQLTDAIHRDVSTLDDGDVGAIASGTVAEWLMRCPLEYSR